jgi:hypothetical protein
VSTGARRKKPLDREFRADNVLKYSVAKRVQRETNDRTVIFIAECHVFIQVIQSLRVTAS